MVTLSVAGQSDGKLSINESIANEFLTIIPFDEAAKEQLIKQLEQVHTAEEKSEFLIKLAHDVYEQREKAIGEQLNRQLEKFVMLSVIDNLWMNHLDAIDNLRQGIGLRGYAQKDPLVEYKNEAFRMFEQLMWGIDDEVVHRIYKYQIQQAPATPEQQAHVHMVMNRPESEVSEGEQRSRGARAQRNIAADMHVDHSGHQHQHAAQLESTAKQKLGRNDPCWCGSGKKWKKCHYPQVG